MSRHFRSTFVVLFFLIVSCTAREHDSTNGSLPRPNSRRMTENGSRSLTSSSVLSLNFGNVLILLLLKAITLGAIYFSASYMGHDYYHSHYHYEPHHYTRYHDDEDHYTRYHDNEDHYDRYYDSHYRKARIDNQSLITSRDFLWGGLYLWSDYKKDFSCLYRLACLDADSADGYLRSGNVAVRIYHDIIRFLPTKYDAKYEKLLSGMKKAMKIRDGGETACRKTFKCKHLFQ